VQRTALAMLTDIRLAEAGTLAELDPEGRRPALTALLGAELTRITHLSDAITRRYFSVVEKEPRWVRAQSRQDP
jgi:hypothetical protein